MMCVLFSVCAAISIDDDDGTRSEDATPDIITVMAFFVTTLLTCRLSNNLYLL